MNKGLKEKILNLYFKKYTYIQIQKELNCSKGTISYHLKNFKDEDRFNISKIEDNIRNKDYKNIVSFYEETKNLLSKRKLQKIAREKFFKESSKKEINSSYYKLRRKEIKQSLVDYKGGCCKKCGYNKSLKALQFHHLIPQQKSFTISANLKSLSIEKIKKELDKCILLCANCHAEIHDN